MLPLLRNALIILAILTGLIFGYFNTGEVPVDYLLGQTDMPLVLALSIALLVGLSLGILVTLPSVLKQRSESTALKRRLQQAETEVKNLRNQPLHDA